MENINQFLRLMKTPFPKDDDRLSIVSLSPDDHEAKEYFQKFQQPGEDDSGILELPPNF